MSSPFPGMDPFIETTGLFPDFHFTFIGCWRDALNEVLPDTYEARIGESYYLIHEDPEPPEHLVRKEIGPDGAVLHLGGEPASAVITGDEIALLEPVTIPLVYADPIRQGYIEIHHRPSRSLVTVMECLLPSNKDSRGRPLYEEKRQSVLVQELHLVELDLVLAGRRLRFGRPLPPGDYYAMISRAEKRPLCDIYAWSVRDRLPRLPIPLRQPDPDVQVDLQAVFETTYERARYARSIDYAAEFTGPADEETRRWIEQRAAGHD